MSDPDDSTDAPWRGKLAGEVVALAAGNSIFAGAQWALTVVIARLSGLAALGDYAVGLAIAAPLFLIANFGLRGHIAAVGPEFRGMHVAVVRLRIGSGGMAALLALAIGIVVLDVPIALMGPIIVAKWVETLSDLSYGYSQHRFRFSAIAISQVARAVIGTSLLLLALSLGTSLVTGLWLLAIAWIVVALAYDLPRIRVASVAHALPIGILGLFRIVWPLGVAAGLISLLPNLPRILIDSLVDNPELTGAFAVFSYLVVVGNLFASSVASALLPRLSTLWISSRPVFLKVVVGTTSAAIALGVVTAPIVGVIGVPALNFVYGDVVSRYASALPMVAITSGITYSSTFVGTGLTAAREYKVQPAILAVATLAVAGAAYACIPRWGVIGGLAAQSMGSAIYSTMGLFHLLRKSHDG